MTPVPAVALLALLAALPAAAQVSPFDGSWGIGDLPECEDGEFSTCPALRIADGQQFGEESRCQMLPIGPVPGLTGAQVFDMACSGEGETWRYTAAFYVDSTGRLTVLTEYGPLIYRPMAGSRGTPAPTK